MWRSGLCTPHVPPPHRRTPAAWSLAPAHSRRPGTARSLSARAAHPRLCGPEARGAPRLLSSLAAVVRRRSSSVVAGPPDQSCGDRAAGPPALRRPCVGCPVVWSPGRRASRAGSARVVPGAGPARVGSTRVVPGAGPGRAGSTRAYHRSCGVRACGGRACGARVCVPGVVRRPRVRTRGRPAATRAVSACAVRRAHACAACCPGVRCSGSARAACEHGRLSRTPGLRTCAPPIAVR